MAIFHFREWRIRRLWVTCLAVAAAGALSAFYVAGASALSGSPSSFESADGNMVVATGDDWESVAFTHVVDSAATTADDSWVNGQKMDSPCAQLATNKNPGKDDFTNVASYTETSDSNHHLYLYGATIRVAANGNASENVELNQKEGTADCPILRTAGDKLLAFDYLNGGTTLDLHVLTWIDEDHSDVGGQLDPGACFVSHDKMPCWGATVYEPNSTTYDGEVNGSTIVSNADPIGNAPDSTDTTQYSVQKDKDLAAGQFAEFGVDLTSALGLSTTACTAFAQTDWESRSSGSSFSSNPQDVAIESKTVSNCGEIKIIKHTSPAGLDQDFTYTTGLSPSSFTLNDKSFTISSISATDPAVVTTMAANGFTTGQQVTISGSDAANGTWVATEISPTEFSIPLDLSEGTAGAGGTAVANLQDYKDVYQGTYTVTEGSDPTGFAFDHVSCSGGEEGSTGANSTSRTATIVLAPGDTVTCTYVNNQVTGAIEITKVSSKKDGDGDNLPLGGAQFTYALLTGGTPGTATDFPSPTDGSGKACVDGLALGTYRIAESTAPTGYAKDAGTQDVTVSVAGTCSTGTSAGVKATPTSSFVDTPLTSLEVIATGEAAEGTTKSTITCTHEVGEATVTVGDSITTPTDAADWKTEHLAPDTYTCTVVIDP